LLSAVNFAQKGQVVFDLAFFFFYSDDL